MTLLTYKYERVDVGMFLQCSGTVTTQAIGTEIRTGLALSGCKTALS